jgi:CPA2 family monovalent cation:H+ antiporter-2
MDYALLRDMEILFGLGILTVVLFRKLYIPTIIGFLAAGILAGPHALGLIGNLHEVEQLAEIGVVFLLFAIGIEFSLGELLRIRQLVFLGGGAQLLLTILAVAAAGHLVGLPPGQAFFFGFLVALSSTAILMKLLLDAGQLDTPQGKTALGILIFQDLCVVPLMLFTPFLAGSAGGWGQLALTVAKAGAVIAAAHFSARYAVPWVFRQVVGTRSRELFLLTLIFIGFGLAWLTAAVGLSLALGAFIAGLAISESEYSHQALGDIIPFRDAFLSLFFISVGMLLDVRVLLERPVAVAAAILAIVTVKAVIATGSVLTLGLPARIAILAGLSLAQVGEFSFVLAQTGISHGLLTPAGYQVFLAAAIVTMALTPLCLKFAPAAADRLLPLFPRRLVRGREALLGRERRRTFTDHVVIVGFGLNGRNLARVLAANDIPYLVIETNPFTVASERQRERQIVFGDASRPEVLEHARIGQARSVVVAISDAAASRRIAAQARQLNPLCHIIVRTRYVAEMEPLYQAGANEVVPEEFETSVEIFARVLRNYLVPQERIEECVAEVRRDSYGMFRSLSRRHRHATGIAGLLHGAEIATFTVQAEAALEGTSLRDGLLRSRSGSSVLAIKRDEELVPNPDPVWEIRRGDLLLLLGTPEQLAAAAPLFAARQG